MTRSARAPAARLNPRLTLAALGGLLALAGAGAVAAGPVAIPWAHLGPIALERLGLLDGAEVKPSHALIVWDLRLPRALGAALVGAVLAGSGTVMQGVFRNPLASPYLLGIASGASAGAALAIVLRLAGFWLPLGAFAGGALAVAAVYGLAAGCAGSERGVTLILAGVALGALFSAVTSFSIFLSGEQMPEIVFWIMGSLGRVGWGALAWLAPLALGGLALLLPFMRELNALALGEAGARSLGIDPRRLVRGLLLATTALTAAAVSVAGTIGFVGLITPHALRLLVGPDHRVLLPAAALGGALFLVLADALARTVWAPVELPVGILTAFTGAPFFLYLLLARRAGALT